MRVKVRPLLVVLAVIAGGASVFALAGLAAGQAPSLLWVDRASLGGACNDSLPANAVTQATPWCSLQRAASAAPSGAIVTVRGGDYGTVELGQLPGRDRGVTLRVAPGEEARIGYLKLTRTSNVRFEGFRVLRGIGIEPGSTNLEFVRNHIEPLGVVIQGGASGLLFEGNFLRTPKGNAVMFSSGKKEPPINDVRLYYNRFDNVGIVGTNIRNFRNVVVHGNEFAGVHSHDGKVHPDVIRTMAGGTGLQITANFLHDNRAQGIFTKDGHVKDVRIENNIIVRNGGKFLPMNIYDADNVAIVNNTVADNGGGVIIRKNARRVDIRNNVLSSIAIEKPSSVTQLDYNFFARRAKGGKGGSGGKSGGSKSPSKSGKSSEPVIGGKKAPKPAKPGTPSGPQTTSSTGGSTQGGTPSGGGEQTGGGFQLPFGALPLPTLPVPTAVPPTRTATPTPTIRLPLPTRTPTRTPTKTPTKVPTIIPTIIPTVVPPLPTVDLPDLPKQLAGASGVTARASAAADTLGGRHNLRDGLAFVDKKNYDYRLAPGSAGIDAATSERAPVVDRYGQSRYDFATLPNRGGGTSPWFDMGAIESQGPRASAATGQTPPAFTMRLLAAGRQRLARGRAVRVRIGCNMRCVVQLKARTQGRGKRRVASKRATLTRTSARVVKTKVGFGKKAARRIKARLRKGKPVKVRVRALGHDSLARPAERTVVIRLRR